MKKIAFFDLEGTLTEGSSWNHIKIKFGAKELSDEYDLLYEEGKVGFEEWRRQLSSIWAKNKVTKQQFIDMFKDFKLKLGAKELISGLKDKGFKIIIITGAPDVFAELVAEELGIDETYSANEFVFKDGFFQDIKTHEEYRRGQGKVHFIRKIIDEKNANKEDCIAIGGDDINDYWMMKELNSFAVKPHLERIKEVVDHEVDELIDVLETV